jgi:hypothetical protein
LVYGEPLTLPGEFLEGAERPPPDFTHQLRQQMNAFQPPATRPQPQQPASTVLSSLMQAQFVYILGPGCKAVSELLLAITITLNRDFHANLDPELTLPRDHSTTELGAKELHFVLIGGSHMRKTAPHLSSMGTKVTDLSIPGWVSNTANGQQLMDRVRAADLMGTITY